MRVLTTSLWPQITFQDCLFGCILQEGTHLYIANLTAENMFPWLNCTNKQLSIV